MTRPDLRPLAVGEIIDTAIKLVVGNARVLFTISSLVLVPLGALQMAVFGLIGADAFSTFETLTLDGTLDSSETDAFIDASVQLGLLVLALVILTGLGTVLVQGASVKAAADVYQGTVPDWRESLRFGLRRFPALLGALILVWLGSSVGLLFCLLPGIWLFVSWSVTVPGVAIESLGPISAMGRSFRLVRPRFWQALGVIFLSTLVYGAVSYIFSLLGSVFTLFEDNPASGVSLLASTISSSISSIIVLPFISAVLTVLYFDLRVRSEGYDLQIMATELGSPTTPSSVPIEPDDPFGLGPPGPG